jgi:hypothetical protein
MSGLSLGGIIAGPEIEGLASSAGAADSCAARGAAASRRHDHTTVRVITSPWLG